jgi:ferredoxin-thioredoxin reductase catalytic chain
MDDREKAILQEARADAEKNGFFLCPDPVLLDDLVAGLATNQKRYGYACCPCRVAAGDRAYDADIICPCEYRDADCHEFGMCFCGLYVSRQVHENPSSLKAIPERRPPEISERSFEPKVEKKGEAQRDSPEPANTRVRKDIPVWRCTVCGYLAAREHPPAICPICKAKAERFERFDLG